jgi:nicotinate-nucleotide adenylyltransferase
MKKVGLYFGTFNPIHVGHLVIANYMANYTDLEEVWLVVSPQNPFKEKDSMLEDYHRLSLVKIAVDDNDQLKASNIEFSLPKPSYTINTLVYLNEKHPNNEFNLIMGEDNLRTFHKWKNYEEILEKSNLYVYPRVLNPQTENKTNSPLNSHPKVKICDAPVMKISSSFIRNAIKNNTDVRYMLTEKVAKYVEEMHFYKK